jgi:hypothetical protein
VSTKPYRPNWYWIGICAVLAAVMIALWPVINRRLNEKVMNRIQRAQLEAAQRDLADSRSEYDRWTNLTHIVVMEAGSEPADKVRSDANEVLTTATKYRNDWNYGNAIHKGNLALGLVALREAKIDLAEDFLLRAGRTPGSPQLSSFGPNMVLAKDLLEKGRREKVLEYFALCGKFWQDDHGRLKVWSALVKEGREPDFGPQLLY